MNLLKNWAVRLLAQCFADKTRRWGWACVLLLVMGCSAKHYRQSADKEVYKIFQQKTPLVPNMETKFTIQTNALVSLEGLPVVTNADDYMGDASSLSSEDLADLALLANRLKAATNELDRFIAAQLSITTQMALSNSQTSPSDAADLQESLVEDFNAIIRGPSIYEERRFAGITLSAQTQQLLARTPPPGSFPRLNRSLLEDAYPSALVKSRSGDEAAKELGAAIVSLPKALEISVKNSRTYQNQKENLYLQALSLTLDRYKFTPIFSSGVSAHYQRTTYDIQNGIDTVTEENHTITAGGSAGGDMLLRTGGRLAADFSTDFLHFVNGDLRAILTPRLGATLVQPLWRGAGYKATMENLTQAERSLLYAMREFVRFRQDNTVRIATAYYGVLQTRDQVKNQWLKLQSVRKSVELFKARTAESLEKTSQLGTVRQSAIATEMGYNNSLKNYRQQLDQFKIDLGLPTDTRLVLDQRELEKLKIVDAKIAVTDAVRVALAARLDFYNTRDRFEDASRKIPIAINGLRPDLNLVLSANVDSKPGSGIQQLDFQRMTWGADVNLDLPLNRKSERNIYRSALINYQRALRDLELAVDNVKLEVYNDVRTLELAKTDYESSLNAVSLGQKRVEEQDLRAELGQATALEAVDAQNAYTDSLNGRTSALVRHKLALLDFWRDLGILRIQDDGSWEEVNQVSKQ